VASPISDDPAYATPDWWKERVRAYYAETTEASFLTTWSPRRRGFHIGLSDGATACHEDAIANTDRYLADLAGIGPGTRVLDAGCGVGASSIWLAAERGAQVVGVTIEPHQAALATRFAEEAGVADRVSFRVEDFAATSQLAASFDVVWNLESICHAFDRRAYLRHAHRLLRDGGRFVCIDYLRTPFANPAPIEAFCRQWQLAPLPSLVEMHAMLETAGFADVRFDDLTARALPSIAILGWFGSETLERLQRERRLLGAPSSPILEEHARGAVSLANAYRSGDLTHHAVCAVRPPRAGAAA
jgi:cyclopropane fatty-acyl-phospholipid synthase-like methyltransferase